MKFYYEKLKPGLSEYDIEFFSMQVNSAQVSASAHVHSAVELLYITNGHFHIDVDGEQAEASRGDIVLFPSGAVHFVYHAEKDFGEYYVLKLTTESLFATFKGKGNRACIIPFTKKQPGERFIFHASELSPTVTEIWQNMIAEKEQKNSAMYTALKAYATQLLISLCRSFYTNYKVDEDELKIDNSIRPLIYKSITYINENAASNLTMEECAKKVNLSYSYYSKSFKAIIGKGFKEYLISIRISKAYNALITTDLSITDIATSYGYNSTAYFISEFKKVYNATPKEIRKNLLSSQKQME